MILVIVPDGKLTFIKKILIPTVHFFSGESMECFSCSARMDFSGNKTDCELIYNSEENRNKKALCLNPSLVCAKYILQRKYENDLKNKTN